MASRILVVSPVALLLLAAALALTIPSGRGSAAYSCGTSPDVISHGPRLGEVTTTSVKVWARACVAATVAVEYKQDSQDWSQALLTAGVATDAGADHTVVVEVSGLAAGTDYDYRLRVDGQLASKTLAGSFHTLPAAGPVSFIMSSDMHHPFQGIPPDTMNVPDQILDLMATKNADFAFMMGDQIVIEIVLNNLGRCCLPQSQADYELAYRDVSAYSHFRDFAANTPLLTTWDDHEIVNDWSAANPNQYLYPWARNAFDAFFGNLNPALLDPSGIQYVYDAGEIEFFALDTRTYRDANLDPDGPEKSMLGDDQKQALKDWLLDSTATFKIIVSSVMFSDFSQHTVFGESWPAFATERDEIMDFIKDNQVSGVLLFSGDEHTGRVFQMEPWDIYEFAPNPLGTKIGSAIAPDPQLKFQSNFVRLFSLVNADTSTCPATISVKLIDEDDVVHYQRDLTEADLDSDSDGDGLLRCDELQGGTDPKDPDTDGDVCGDGAEVGANHMAGGQRDPTDEWDYFNPTGDGRNRIDDVLKVVGQYFVDSPHPDYTTSTDRTPGAAIWAPGPPNGQQRIDDIIAIVKSYFNDCGPIL